MYFYARNNKKYILITMYMLHIKITSKFGLVQKMVYMYHVFHWLAKKINKILPPNFFLN